MIINYVAYLTLALIVVVFFASAIRILREYERGVVFMEDEHTVVIPLDWARKLKALGRKTPPCAGASPS